MIFAQVAAQILQRLRRTSQRGLGIHHPVVFVELSLPLAPVSVRTLRVTLNLAVLVGGRLPQP